MLGTVCADLCAFADLRGTYSRVGCTHMVIGSVGVHCTRKSHGNLFVELPFFLGQLVCKRELDVWEMGSKADRAISSFSGRLLKSKTLRFLR